jgi:hypothetical protein
LIQSGVIKFALSHFDLQQKQQAYKTFCSCHAMSTKNAFKMLLIYAVNILINSPGLLNFPVSWRGNYWFKSYLASIFIGKEYLGFFKNIKVRNPIYLYTYIHNTLQNTCLSISRLISSSISMMTIKITSS